MKKINVLSLFGGIEVGRQALEDLPIDVGLYYCSEIDKNAIKVSKKNFPDIIHLGDINNWREWDIDWGTIDLVFSGFPCQNFSIAGNKTNLKGETGKLFYVFRDILNHIKELNPNIRFLAENVPMKEEVAKYISQELGVDYVEIDSALFSAQTRRRYYWTNIPISSLPGDNSLVLEDILEQYREDSYFNWYSCAFSDPDESKIVACHLHINGHDYIKRVNSRRFKAQTLCRVNGGSQHRKVYLNGRVRRLTPIEYERLQGLEDDFTKADKVSNTARYSAVGNSWNLQTIIHILKGLDCINL